MVKKTRRKTQENPNDVLIGLFAELRYLNALKQMRRIRFFRENQKDIIDLLPVALCKYDYTGFNELEIMQKLTKDYKNNECAFKKQIKMKQSVIRSVKKRLKKCGEW